MKKEHFFILCNGDKMHLNICVRFKKSPKSDDLLGPTHTYIAFFGMCYFIM